MERTNASDLTGGGGSETSRQRELVSNVRRAVAGAAAADAVEALAEVLRDRARTQDAAGYVAAAEALRATADRLETVAWEHVL